MNLGELNSKYLGFKVRDAFYGVIIVGLVFFGWRAYKDLGDNVQSVHIAYKQLTETLARAQNDLVSKKDLQEFASQTNMDMNKIKSDLQDLNAHLVAVGQTVASIDGRIESNQSPDHEEPHTPPTQPTTCTTCDLFGYTTKRVATDIMLGDMPFGEVWFDASNEKPFTTKYDAIDVKVSTVIGEQDDSTHDGIMVFYHTISTVNKTDPNLAGKEFVLKTTSSEYKQLLEKSTQFYWWAPHLDLAIDNTLTLQSDTFFNPGASLGLSIMGYGRTKNDLDWKFIRVGIGANVEKNFYLTLQPVEYNIGKFIPLLSDLWVGIGASYDFSNTWGLSLSISTTL